MRQIIFSLASLFVLTASKKPAFHNVYWNSSNPLFETFDNAIDSPGYYEVAGARPGDVVRFHCPRRRHTEYSRIYKVTHADFRQCILSDDAELVGSCDSQRRHSTIIRHQLEAEHKETAAYFITTSTGEEDGLDSRRLGLCLEKNMRVAVSMGPPHMSPYADSVFGMGLDASMNDDQQQIYLAEENGVLSWKKNVHPQIERELDQELIELRMKFDKSRQIEPIPIDAEFVSRLEEYRRRHESSVVYKDKTDKLEPMSPVSRGSQIGLFSALLVCIVGRYHLL